MRTKILVLLVLTACTLASAFWGSDDDEKAKETVAKESATEQSASAPQWAFAPKDYNRKEFKAQPTPVDTLLRGKELELPAIDPSLRNSTGEFDHLVSKEDQSKSNDLYVLQFEALADFDAAQKRRAILMNRTGYSIHLVFNAPFYKLRSGRYTSKEKAEDAVAQLAAINVTAFVVKLK